MPQIRTSRRATIALSLLLAQSNAALAQHQIVFPTVTPASLPQLVGH